MLADSAPPALPAISLVEDGALLEWLQAEGQPTYRLQQIRRALAAGAGFEQMSALPTDLRTRLAQRFRPRALAEIERWDSDQGLTTKILYGLDGGYTVESVVMRYERRSTLCISSQVGCPIGCPFCATGQGPFGRNLKAGEIVDQAIAAAALLVALGRRLTHVVYMGMGEPLANYEAVVQSVRGIADSSGLGISPRRITVSTAGLVPRIDQLSQESLPLTLAISLHAARDELRDFLVPINRQYPLADLTQAAARFANRTGRRVSYEWVLLAEVNDSDQDARELIELTRQSFGHVNLIPFNPVPGADFKEPDPGRIARFAGLLREGGVQVTVRDTRGRENAAACGQLRARAIGAGVITA
ncbi:MAG: 23S rRNA (adenine(2503)-C(2))-methyltransferase RlmN [Candidatus Dormibacteraceae bacterium]